MGQVLRVEAFRAAEGLRVAGALQAVGSSCGFICGSLVGKLLKYLLHPSHLSALKTDFDAVRVSSRLGEDIFNDPLRELPGPLVLFQYY